MDRQCVPWIRQFEGGVVVGRRERVAAVRDFWRRVNWQEVCFVVGTQVAAGLLFVGCTLAMVWAAFAGIDRQARIDLQVAAEQQGRRQAVLAIHQGIAAEEAALQGFTRYASRPGTNGFDYPVLMAGLDRK